MALERRCTQRALDFLEKHKDEDFLLVISYDEPHGPALCPVEYTRMYEDFTLPTNTWPAHAPANTRSKSLVSHINLGATMMEFFGFEVPKTLEGVSALPLFENPQATVQKDVFIEWTRYEVDHDGFGGFQPIRCICDGRYKLGDE